MLHWLKEKWEKLKRPKTPTARAMAGARGEQAAADFLKNRHGFTVLIQNWRNPRDLREVLVFVEVKARAVGALVTGYYAVDERKKRALRRSVHAYLAALSTPPRTFRFDVVEVTLSGRLPPQVMHYANAPLFPAGYHIARQSSSLGEGAL